MPGLEMIAAVTAALVALGVWESLRHRRMLQSVPIRIHVNGTRGKSSVVRLIAAGLRAGGITTLAKTTGTLARVILPDGREVPVFRPARANINEQIRIVATAAEVGAEALVIECMALQPLLQWLSESRFVRATHGVITNARPDHLDVMGPGEVDVAHALAGMIPPGMALYTAERDHLQLFEAHCADRQAQLQFVGPEAISKVSLDDLAGFSYTEHPENLALALRICTDLGVDREVALKGMWAAIPDPGAMTTHFIEFFGRRLAFVHGFAANDPESTEQIWRMALEQHPEVETRVQIFNCRADRADRSRQLGAACADWPRADQVVLMGTGTYIFAKAAVGAGLDPSRLVYCEDARVDEIFEAVVSVVGPTSMVMGLGNVGGLGLDLVRYFRNREMPALPPQSPARLG